MAELRKLGSPRGQLLLFVRARLAKSSDAVGLGLCEHGSGILRMGSFRTFSEQKVLFRLSLLPAIPCVWIFSDFKACREKEAERHETCNASKGYDHKASKEIVVDTAWLGLVT